MTKLHISDQLLLAELLKDINSDKARYTAKFINKLGRLLSTETVRETFKSVNKATGTANFCDYTVLNYEHAKVTVTKFGRVVKIKRLGTAKVKSVKTKPDKAVTKSKPRYNPEHKPVVVVKKKRTIVK